MPNREDEKIKAKSKSGKERRSLAERLEASPRLFLGMFTFVYAVGMALHNSRRPFWVDELFTSFLADLPSIGQILPLVARGIELNPPLPFWLTWIVHHTVGQGEVLTRLPSTIGFWVMCVCLFHFVRRRSDAVHGFIALLLPLFTYSASDATYARGYGLMLGFSAMALLCWQLATEGVKRPVSLACLSLSIFGAISCHYYAVYVAGALVLGECDRTRANKRIDMCVWAAFAGGVSALLVYAPLIMSASEGLDTFWITAMPRFLYESYADLLGPIMIVVLLLLGLVLRKFPTEEPQWQRASLTGHEATVCIVLAAMPLAVYLGALVSRAAFFPRYVQPVVIGYTILAAMFVYRVGGSSKRFRNTVASLLVWLCLAPWLLWQGTRLILLPKPALIVTQKIHYATISPHLPVVIDSEEDFFQVYHYGPKQLTARTFMLSDFVAAVKFEGSDTILRSLTVAQSVKDHHVVPYQDFIAAHSKFILVRSKPGSWIQQKLIEDGADLKLVQLDKPKGVFVDDTLIFRVTVAGMGSNK